MSQIQGGNCPLPPPNTAMCVFVCELLEVCVECICGGLTKLSCPTYYLFIKLYL